MGTAANVIVGPATISYNSADLGFTQDGVRLRNEREYVDVLADQAKGVVKKVKSLERFFVATTLLEATLDNLELAWDQPDGSLATSNNIGNAESQEAQLVVVGKAPSDGTRTFTLNKAVSIADAEYNNARDAAGTLEVEFECLKEDDEIFGTVVDT